MRRIITAVVAILGLLLASQPIATATTKQPAATCKNYNLDLMETSLGLWLQGLSVRIKGSEKDYFKIDKVVLNKFDPCAELSWVILRGSEAVLSNTYDPPQDEDFMHTIVFFNKDKLITKAKFLGAKEIKEVKQNNTKATVSYSVQSGNKRSTKDVNYYFDDGKISTEAGISNDLTSLDLDFGRGTLPIDAKPIPLGNANYHPADQEFDEDTSANIYIGDTMLLCSFFITRRNDDASCVKIGDPSWPLIKSKYTPNEDAQVGPNGKTNTVKISFGSPSIVNTTYYLPGRAIYAPEKFPDNSITRIGRYFVSTHGDTVKISDNYFTATLSEGNVTTKNEPLIKLDTSRYPTVKN